MILRQLQYALAVARSGSARGAARDLYIGEPTISVQVRKLERELRIAIFERRGRQLLLTREGTELLPGIVRVIAAVEDLKKTARELGALNGSLRIGFIPSCSRALMPLLLPWYAHQYPELRFEVIEGGSIALERLVHEGQLDLAIVKRSPVIASNFSDVGEEIITRGKLQLAVGTAHPFTVRKSVRVDELPNCKPIIFADGYLLREILLNVLHVPLAAGVLCASGNTESTRELVQSGDGALVLADFELAEIHRNIAPLRTIEIEDIPLEVRLSCVFRTDKHGAETMAGRTRAFLVADRFQRSAV